MKPMSESPRVTVIIPNWNTRRWLPGCLDGLRAQTYRPFETLLVDNGSTDGSLSFVRQNYPEVRIIALPENRGFAGGVHVGIRATQSEYVALLNVDTVPQPDWLSSLVAAMEASPPDVGALASRMLSLHDPSRIDDAGDILSWYGSARKRGMGEPAKRYDQQEEVFSICAGAALYRRSFLEKTGGFDEQFTSYLEDVDLGLRGRLLGYRYLFIPTAEVYHAGQGAGTPRPRYVYLMTRNRLALLTKNIPRSLLSKHWRTLLYGQLYFSLVYKHPLSSMAGIWAWVRSLPRLLRQRREIQKHKVISDAALDAMLSCELGEPSLREIIANKFRGRRP
ncbi:MAG TPA: glycosyltransferase family 2 protein [Chloroflexi bacterium]|nr:glycosyltransferase family 2 protein [Chloroflexota bacterium]